MRIPLEQAKMYHDHAADEVLRELGNLSSRIDRVREQMNRALDNLPIALDQPEWVSQDALRVTVAIAKYEQARREYGWAINDSKDKDDE